MHRGCAADLRSLAKLIPARSRLLLRPPADPDAALLAAAARPAAAEGDDAAEVATSSVRAGDLLLVRPFFIGMPGSYWGFMHNASEGCQRQWLMQTCHRAAPILQGACLMLTKGQTCL